MNWLELLVALCFAECIHNMVEVWGMSQKVHWLDMTMQGKEHGHWPLNIDSLLKTILLHGGILLLFGGLAWLTLDYLDLADRTLIIVGIVLLLDNYIVTTWKVNSFHTKIGRLISKQKAK